MSELICSCFSAKNTVKKGRGQFADGRLVYSRLNFCWGSHAHRGNRDYMEDFAFGQIGFDCQERSGKDPLRPSETAETPTSDLSLNCLRGPKARFGMFGVMDGHGGQFSAKLANDLLPKGILRFFSETPSSELPTMLSKVFRLVDSILVEEPTSVGTGCTALIALISEDKLYIANAGDSSAILSRNDGETLHLNSHHRPCDPVESARVIAAGGQVKVAKGTLRVFDGDGGGGIAVTRSLGDSHYKQKESPLLISDPQVKVYEITAQDDFLILASDGLTDVMSPDEAVEILRSQNFSSAEAAAQHLTKLATCRRANDNVTVIVVFLGAESAFAELHTQNPVARAYTFETLCTVPTIMSDVRRSVDDVSLIQVETGYESNVV